MKKLFAFVLLVAFFALGANAQLLYKISGKGLEKPSYIVGTYHLANVKFVDSIPGIRQAMADVEQVYGEVATSEMHAPDNLMKMQQAMFLPDGKTLSDVLTKEEMGKLNAFLKKQMGVDLTNPVMAQQMGRLSPMALNTQLTVLMYLKNHPTEFDPTKGFDDYFQQQAIENGKPVAGLETFEFQMETMFGGKDMKRQVELLMCLIDHGEFMQAMTDRIVKAFYSQDMEAIFEAMNEKLNNHCDMLPEEESAFLNDRNADWLTKMPGIMKAHSTLFVVGAGHLPGEFGVLEGLKQLGYTVEGVR